MYFDIHVFICIKLRIGGVSLMKTRKTLVLITVLFLLASACGGGSETSETVTETSTSTTTTSTTLPGEIGEVVDEAALVVPPILLKPLIGATGVLTSTSEDWETVSAIVPLDMGVKIRTADNGTAQMTFEDGSALLMGGNSVISVRSFDYDEEAGARVLTVDVISGSIAYDIFSEGLSASLAKIVTPTAELSVHGTEGVFEYDVSTFSAKSTVLEGGEENDDAVFSELLPDEDGNPVLVAVSQTAGTELGSSTTGGSGWVEEDSSKVALIVDEFVSNMEGDCSYTCKAETQENLAEGSEDLTPDVAANAVFTDSDTERMELAQTLLVAAGAPENIQDSVETLSEAVAEVAVSEDVVKEFIDANWQEAPEDGTTQELPPTADFFNTFSDAATVHENEDFENLGFDHNENGNFRSQHGMMQFISADTNAVNELAETGDVASAMALAASNMFVNAGQEEFAEGTYCADNPDDPDCSSGGPPPEFLAQAFAGNHFVEDMVQGMGFEYTFTENDVKPSYCDEQSWLPECASGPEFVGDAFEEGGAYCEANPEECEGGGPEPGKMFFGGGPKEDSFCADNPDAQECMGGNAQAVYAFFHVYDEDVLGDNWEPVDCGQYPDDPMCTGEGDFFHEHVGDATGLALDRKDMFDIYGGPQELAGPPQEFCQENPDAPECADDYKPSDVFTGGSYVAPGYCNETPDAPECNEDFGQGGGLKGPLTGGLLAQYAAPDPNAQAGEAPSFCAEYPNHPECFREYHGEGDLNTGEFLGNMFSSDSYVDLAQQGVFYDSIEGADDLASQRYGNHDDYLIHDCTSPDHQNDPQCSQDYDPAEYSLYAGGGSPGEGPVEYESISSDSVDEICATNPYDPICYASDSAGEAGDFGQFQGESDTSCEEDPNQPWCNQVGGSPGESAGGFWGNAEQATQFQDQQQSYTQSVGQYCDEYPDDPGCQEGGQAAAGGIIVDQDCDENPYAPGCPQSGGQEGTGPPPGGEGGTPPDPAEYCADNPDDSYCQSGGQGGGDQGGGGQTDEDCANNPYAPGCAQGGDQMPSGDDHGGVDCAMYPDAPECSGHSGDQGGGDQGGYVPPGGGGDMPPEQGGVDCSVPGNESLPECGGGNTTFDCSDPAYAAQCGGSQDTQTGDQGTLDCSIPENATRTECGANPGGDQGTPEGSGGDQGGYVPPEDQGGGDQGGGDQGGGDQGGGGPPP